MQADLNEIESENFSAYQGCPNAATRINTHATIVIDIQPSWTHRVAERKEKKKETYGGGKRWRRRTRGGRNGGCADAAHPFPLTLRKRSCDCCWGLLATFSKKKKWKKIEWSWRSRRKRRRRGGLHAGSALFFGRRCTGARENKHRKDRNCFSERFDSRQMNLLKYTRNSTSRQYLHGRGGRIYICAGCTAPLKPPSVSTKRRYGPCGRSFYCCRATRSGLRKKSHAQREIERFFFLLRRFAKQDSISRFRIDTMRERKRVNRKNNIDKWCLLFRQKHHQ